MPNKRRNALLIAALIVMLLLGASHASAQVSTYLQNGERFLAEGSWASAINEFRFALNSEPQNSAAWYGLGRAFEGLSGAKARFDSLVESLTGAAGTAYEPMGQQDAANLEEAIKAYTNASSFYPPQAAAAAALGRAQFMAGRTQEALYTLERAAGTFTLNNDALAHMLYISMLTGDAQRLQYYSSLAKGNAQAMSDQGVVHALAAMEYRAGNFKGAESLLTPLMYRYDLGYLPLKAMGDILIAQSRPTEALDFFRYAANVNPKSEGAQLMTGDILSLIGNPAGAVSAYRAALAAMPGSFWAKLGLARSLAETNDVNGALVLAKELTEKGIGPEADVAFTYRAILERTLGQLQQAELSLKSALVLNPSNQVVTQYLSLVQSEMRAKGMGSLAFDGIPLPAFDGFVINGGAKVTNNRKVTLSVNTTAAYTAFKNENSDYGSWNFKFGTSASYDWLLSEGDGKKTVRMRTREGLFSVAQEGPVREITLDATPPAITGQEAKLISGNVFAMKLGVTEAMSGIKSFWLSTDGAQWKPYRWIGSSFPFTFVMGSSRVVSAAVVDGAGNFAPVQVDISQYISGPVITNVTAQETSAGTVNVKWATDRPASSYVEYKLGQSANVVGSETSTRSHSVDVAGLLPGQTYQFKPISVDAYGLKTEGQAVTLTTSAAARPPAITGISVSNVTANTATVAWSTDAQAYGYIVYSSGGQQLTSQQVGPSTRHQVTISALQPITTYQYQIVAWDSAGRQAYSDVRTFTTLSADRSAPRINSFRINGGAASTNNRTISLELYATDESGFVAEMSFRDDSSNWSTWSAYSSFASFVLSDREGARTVYARVRDAAGNVSTEATTTISLDRTAPRIGWVGAQAGIDNAEVTWDTDENSDSWVFFGTSSVSLTFSAGQGDSTRAHRVFLTGLRPDTTYFYKVMSRDSGGNSAESSVASFRTQASIPADTKAPTGSLTINDNTLYTRSRYVYLNLSATDDRSSQAEIQFRVGEGASQANVAWGSWQGFSSRVQYIMGYGDGQRNIWVMYRDAAGNTSPAYGAYVVLDTKAPSITNLAVSNVTTQSAVVSFRTSEPSFANVEYGTASFSLSLSAGDSEAKSASVSSAEPTAVIITPNPSPTRTGSTNFNFSLTGLRASTTYYYRVVAVDLAGNAAATQVASFRTPDPAPVDTMPPSGSVTINDNTMYTRSRYIYLNLNAQDNMTPTSGLQYRIGEGISSFSISWGNWTQFANRVPYTLSYGDGQRNIWVMYMDGAGNVSQAYGAQIILDTRAPSILNLGLANVTQTSAVVTFMTNEPAFGSVEYGTSSIALSLSTGDSEAKSASVSSAEPSAVIITPNPSPTRTGATNFNVTITGLRPGTTYYFRAVAMDLAGNASASQVGSFRTQDAAPADTMPPTGSITINDNTMYTRSRYVYLNLNAQDNVTPQASIQYRIGEGTSSFNVVWGNWTQFAGKVPYTMAQGDGQRNIWAMYRDAAGNVSQAYVAQIILDTKAPTISNLMSGNITDSSATITWYTNEPAFGSVEFGTSASSLSAVSGDADVRSSAATSSQPSTVIITPNPSPTRIGSTNFSLNLTGLKPNTTYYFRAVAMDLAGNVAVSQTASFRTAATSTPPVVTPPVVTPPVTPPVVTPPVVTPPVVTPPVTPTQPGLVNLAGKSQGTKTNTNGWTGGNTAALAIDENVSSFWLSKGSATSGTPQWIEVNFQKTVALNNVVIKIAAPSAPKSMKLMALINEKWTEIYDYKDNKAAGTTPSQTEVVAISMTFSRVQATAIRVYYYDMLYKDEFVKIYEVEAYNK